MVALHCLGLKSWQDISSDNTDQGLIAKLPELLRKVRDQ
jgi:hypothetical protein